MNQVSLFKHLRLKTLAIQMNEIGFYQNSRAAKAEIPGNLENGKRQIFSEKEESSGSEETVQNEIVVELHEQEVLVFGENGDVQDNNLSEEQPDGSSQEEPDNNNHPEDGSQDDEHHNGNGAELDMEHESKASSILTENHEVAFIDDVSSADQLSPDINLAGGVWISATPEAMSVPVRSSKRTRKPLGRNALSEPRHHFVMRYALFIKNSFRTVWFFLFVVIITVFAHYVGGGRITHLEFTSDADRGVFFQDHKREDTTVPDP